MPRTRRLVALGSIAGLAISLLNLPLVATAASQTARYEVRFDATWSAATHPIDFPPSPHLSPLVGGTHDASVLFWEPGALASTGIKDMAERGLTAPLASEVSAAVAAGSAAAVLLGGGISPSPGTVVATFDMTQLHPLVTLVSMIAPSPDWFVGVSGLALFANGAWVERVVVPLPAYDAGTDSGTFYTAPNQATVPPVPIALNGAAPFASGTPAGLFTFTRLDAPIGVQTPAVHGGWLAALGGVLLVTGGVVARRRALRAAAGR